MYSDPKRLLLIPMFTSTTIAAPADCAPVIAAFDKADATKRCAPYEVETMTHEPKGVQFMIVIGDVESRQKYERRGPASIAKARFEKGIQASSFDIFRSIGPEDGSGFPWVYGDSALPPVPGASQ